MDRERFIPPGVPLGASSAFPASATKCSRTTASGGTQPFFTALVSAGTKSFLRDTKPGRASVCAAPSATSTTVPPYAATAKLASTRPHTTSVESSATISTTARSTASTVSSATFTARISGTSSFARASDAGASVVSTTAYATVYVFFSPTSLANLNRFTSPFTSAYGVMSDNEWLFARNCLAASSLTSFTFRYCTSIATMRSSHAVVVGDRKFSVSLNIAESNIPATFLGRNFSCVAKLCAIMDDMHPHGLMSTKMGFSVTMVLLCNAWWSMTPTMFAMGIALLSCDCCWKSTRHTLRLGSFASVSSIGSGSSTPHSLSANSVSVLISDAIAGSPPYRCAAPMAPATESRSVMMWPTNAAPASSGTNDSAWPSFLGRWLNSDWPSVQCASTACSRTVSSRSTYVLCFRCSPTLDMTRARCLSQRGSVFGREPAMTHSGVSLGTDVSLDCRFRRDRPRMDGRSRLARGGTRVRGWSRRVRPAKARRRRTGDGVRPER
mmetsp:Transcript_13271/g.55722  ORF Transcript_13271/g.55722 Transcript_13271/m.55722 type:complete len:496 (-) Transcript_13271:57-1544(-)